MATTFPDGADPTLDLMVPDGLWLSTTDMPLLIALIAAFQTWSYVRPFVVRTMPSEEPGLSSSVLTVITPHPLKASDSVKTLTSFICSPYLFSSCFILQSQWVLVYYPNT